MGPATNAYTVEVNMNNINTKKSETYNTLTIYVSKYKNINTNGNFILKSSNINCYKS